MLADAFEIGAQTLPRTPALNRDLASVFDSLAEFAEDPLVPRGIRRLRDTARSLKPTIAFLTPAQTTCNYVTLFFRNVSSLLSEGDSNGTWQRFIIIAAPVGPNNEGSPSSAPGNGPDPDELLAREPVPEHGVAGADQGVRGRQRGLPPEPPGDRQRARQPGHQDRRPARSGGRGVRRVGGERLNRFQAGLIALLVIAVGTWFAFAKDIPFTKPYEMQATFDNAASIQLRSPVRIAGVNVGQVSKVEPADDDSTATVVTMKLEDEALPIHKNAELKIRPRIFLEGNFFVDLKPGTPAAGEIDPDDPIPSTQTAAPVQLDQVLGTLKSDARKDLQELVQGLGEGFGGEPKPDEEADDDPDTRGETAGESLNDSLDDSPEALRGTAIVNDALLGRNAGDLRRLIKGTQKVSAALASREDQLKDLISNFNITTGALAAEQASLRRTIRAAARRCSSAANPALDQLNASFPSLRAFSLELIPGVRETPATIDGGAPVDRPGAPARLAARSSSGLVERPPARHPRPGQVHRRLRAVPPAGRPREPLPAEQPAAHRRRGDPGRQPHHRRRELQGVLPEPGGPDAASRRTSTATASTRASRPAAAPTACRPARWAPTARCSRNALRPPLGTRPARPAASPPKRRDRRLPHAEAARPELGADRRRPVTRAIRKHLRDFLAILFMVLVAAGVAGYILSNQRFYLPAWVPVVGTDFYEVEAELRDRAGRGAGPGPDREHRRREDRRHRLGASSRTAARWWR